MIIEKTVVGAGTEYPLNGILTLPDDFTEPVPAAVLVHGSGPSDMDERVLKLTPFKDLAEGLAERGVATLRFDKRTFVYRRKMAKTCPTEEESIEDAVRAVALLKEDRRIDPGRIFLIGHSEGGMLAPRIGEEAHGVKGLVLMAASPYRLEEIVLRQLRQAGEKAGRVMKGILDLELKHYTKMFDGLYEMDDEKAKKKKFGGSLPLYYFKEMGQKTAADYLLESDKPVLILQGGKDFQVLADDDFRKFRELLSNRPDTEFRLYPELNHCFVEGGDGDILRATKEYGTERHMGDEVLGDIADFILAN